MCIWWLYGFGESLTAEPAALKSALFLGISVTTSTPGKSVSCSLPSHIHFIGALGRGMGAVVNAVVATGVKVTGSDRPSVYGASRDRLRESGVVITLGFDPAHLQPRPDLVVIGRSFGRGNPEVEAVLSQSIPYLSLSQFLCVFFLNGSRNLLVAGSSGKTTTTAMLVQILESAGLHPGYMIGGSPRSGLPAARLGGELHVLEADEYTSLWCNDHSKFLDYRPNILVITNVFPDHPDVFPDHELALVQYRALISQLPQSGLLVIGESRLSVGIETLLAEAPCRVEVLDADMEMPERTWDLRQASDALSFSWKETCFELALPGAINARNSVCASLAAAELGVTTAQSAQALRGFRGVQGRLEHLESPCMFSSIDLYVDSYGYLPISLLRNLETLRSLHPGRSLVLLYQVFIVDRIPSIRDQLLSVLLQWDKVVIVSEPMQNSITLPVSSCFVNSLVGDLAGRGMPVNAPMSLAASMKLLASDEFIGSTVFCSLHPSLVSQVYDLASASLDA
jgi:UDP-N-acetylmuramate: L-alanyl-gamma-D-glutamyl-meso-diaminopimelate ligase